MQKKLTALVAFLITALVLVSCSVEVSGGGDFGGNPALNITQDVPDNPNATVRAESTVTFEARFPENFNKDVLVIDLMNVSNGVEMNIRNADGDQIAFTDSYIFGKNKAAVQSLSTSDIGTNAIGAGGWAECFGFCIILPKSVYMNNALDITVRNPTSNQVEVYAFGAIYYDLNEPNDTFSQAQSVDFEGEDGAFEVLGDVDFWKPFPNEGGTFFIEISQSQLELDMVVYDKNGNPVDPPATLLPDPNSNLRFKVMTNTDEVMALSLDGDVAASADMSKYKIWFESAF